MGERVEVCTCLELLDGLACDQAQPEGGLRLIAAAAAIRAVNDVPVPPVLKPEYDRDVAAARAALGSRHFESAWNAGLGLRFEQLPDAARELVDVIVIGGAKVGPRSSDPLTPREREVVLDCRRLHEPPDCD